MEYIKTFTIFDDLYLCIAKEKMRRCYNVIYFINNEIIPVNDINDLLCNSNIDDKVNSYLDTNWYEDKSVEIKWVETNPQCRNNGFASLLIYSCALECIVQNIKHIKLEDMTSNHSSQNHIYKNIGFNKYNNSSIMYAFPKNILNKWSYVSNKVKGKITKYNIITKMSNFVSNKVKKKKNVISNKNITACSICLEALEIDNNLVKSECEHFFHKNCIYPLLTYNDEDIILVKCPVCRKNNSKLI